MSDYNIPPLHDNNINQILQLVLLKVRIETDSHFFACGTLCKCMSAEQRLLSVCKVFGTPWVENTFFNFFFVARNEVLVMNSGYLKYWLVTTRMYSPQFSHSLRQKANAPPFYLTLV